jgi:spore germination cell wall hydrolase CwlJ-like protein
MMPISTSANEYLWLLDKTQVTCLAKNIYHESRGESVRGQEAVALVTLNRVRDPRWPDTICKVVYERNQFSWTRKPKPIKNAAAWNRSLALAYKVLNGNILLVNFKAVYFHTPQVNPRWKHSVRKVASIGNHIFYS